MQLLLGRIDPFDREAPVDKDHRQNIRSFLDENLFHDRVFGKGCRLLGQVESLDFRRVRHAFQFAGEGDEVLIGRRSADSGGATKGRVIDFEFSHGYF